MEVKVERNSDIVLEGHSPVCAMEVVAGRAVHMIVEELAGGHSLGSKAGQSSHLDTGLNSMVALRQVQQACLLVDIATRCKGRNTASWLQEDFVLAIQVRAFQVSSCIGRYG